MSTLNLNYFFSALLTAVTTFVLAIFVLSRNPKSKVYRTYFLYTICISIWSIQYAFMPVVNNRSTAELLAHGLHYGVGFICVFFVHFIFNLLDTKKSKIRIVMWPLYIIACLFAATVHTEYLVSGVTFKFGLKYFVEPGPLYLPYVSFLLACVGYGLIELLIGYRRARPERRNQLKYLFYSTLVGYIGGAANFALVFDFKYPFFPYGTYAVPLYVAIVAYAIIPYRLIDIKVYLSRAIVVVSVFLGTMFVALWTTFLSKRFLVWTIGDNWWYAPLIGSMVLMACGYALSLHIVKGMDKRRLSKLSEAREALEISGRGMIEIDSTRRLARIIPRYLTMFYLKKLRVRISHATIFLQDKETGEFILESSAGEEKFRKGRIISKGHPLNIWFTEKRTFFLDEHIAKRHDMDVLKYEDIDYWMSNEGLLKRDDELPFLLKRLKKEMDELKATVCVPSFYKNKLVGFLLLGHKSHGLYNEQELDIFALLAASAAAAFRGAQLADKLRETQTNLVASERLAAIGRLATSAKHEINNPLQGIYGGFNHALSMLEDVKDGFYAPRERIRALYWQIKQLASEWEDNALTGKLSVIDNLLSKLESRSESDRAFREQLEDTGDEISELRDAFEELINETDDEDVKDKADEIAYLLGTVTKMMDKIRNMDGALTGALNEGFESAQRISQVIDAMYNLPKELDKKLGPLDVTTLINSSFEFVKYQTYWENLTDTTTIIEIPPGLPKIKGYTNRLVSVFSNLIINAYQAMTDDGVTSTRQRIIRTVAEVDSRDSSFLEIRVSNKGPAIPEESLKNIFEQGFTTKEKSSGLGLHICKIQVEEFNNGAISARNIPDFGPEFKVRLPIWKEGVQYDEKTSHSRR